MKKGEEKGRSAKVWNREDRQTKHSPKTIFAGLICDDADAKDYNDAIRKIRGTELP